MKKLLLIATLSLIAASAVLANAQQKKGKQLKAKATAHSVVLSWGASTVPTGAPPVTGYNVYRSTTSGGEGSTPLASPGNVLTYTDLAVTAGTTYFYQVTAVNTSGESLKSNETSAAVPNSVPPNAPTNLAATAQ